jgi:ribosomal protein L6P/L9E
MQVMIAEAKKQFTGTNIDLGGKKTNTKELELFETNRKLNSELIDVISSKSNMYEVINVISSFQPIGSEIKGVTKNYAFLLAILGVGFMILVLLLRILNRYLASYDK